jgi:oligopeptide/dipeptide ABC transporter ATP-binding protein
VTDTSGVPLLACDNLSKRFAMPAGPRSGGAHRWWSSWQRSTFYAIRNVSLSVANGEALGLVGESGCGKSTLARVLGLLYRAEQGTVRFQGHALARAHPFRGARHGLHGKFRRSVQMVFQDPFASLNPRHTIGKSITEPLRIHRIATESSTLRRRALDLLNSVGLSPALIDRYPHELSGGQRQRVAIGRALALEPAMLIADEPLSALDVTVQRQILDLLRVVRAERDLALLFISHDLAAVEFLCDRIAVMYLGRVVEVASRERLFEMPGHPYTQDLIDAVPRIPTLGNLGNFRDSEVLGDRRDGAPRVMSDVASVLNPPPGCAYHRRCVRASARCRDVIPPLTLASPPGEAEHHIACHHPLGTYAKGLHVESHK